MRNPNDTKSRKAKLVKEILDNPTCLPESLVYQACKNVLWKLSVNALENLSFVIQQKEAHHANRESTQGNATPVVGECKTGPSEQQAECGSE